MNNSLTPMSPEVKKWVITNQLTLQNMCTEHLIERASNLGLESRLAELECLIDKVKNLHIETGLEFTSACRDRLIDLEDELDEKVEKFEAYEKKLRHPNLY